MARVSPTTGGTVRALVWGVGWAGIPSREPDEEDEGGAASKETQGTDRWTAGWTSERSTGRGWLKGDLAPLRYEPHGVMSSWPSAAPSRPARGTGTQDFRPAQGGLGHLHGPSSRRWLGCCH